jgi:hypothetical protein
LKIKFYVEDTSSFDPGRSAARPVLLPRSHDRQEVCRTGRLQCVKFSAQFDLRLECVDPDSPGDSSAASTFPPDVDFGSTRPGARDRVTRAGTSMLGVLG